MMTDRGSRSERVQLYSDGDNDDDEQIRQTGHRIAAGVRGHDEHIIGASGRYTHATRSLRHAGGGLPTIPSPLLLLGQQDMSCLHR